MSSSQSDIIAKVRAVEALARTIYPSYNKPPLRVSFFAKGRTAGWAKYEAHEVQFNLSQMVQNDSVERLTVPHEVAHIVCNAVFGETGHGKKWKVVCLMLGGDGKRCYNAAERGITVVKARVNTRPRQTKKYLYLTSHGNEIWLGAARHNKIMKGAVYTTATGAKISASGFQGQSRMKLTA